MVMTAKPLPETEGQSVQQPPQDLKSFFDALRPLESFVDIDAMRYVDDIRSTSRILRPKNKFISCRYRHSLATPTRQNSKLIKESDV